MKKLLYILLFVAVPTLMVAQDKLLPVQQQDYTKEMGDSAYSQGRFGEAVKIYESLIAANGGNVELYYNLGNAIETVESDESKAVEIYNTMGQKVAKATKGIYLINGKKVLFK
jgi:tetratricopeptide (TPR) repeat protein